MDEEGITRTDNDLIWIGHPIETDDETFMRDLQILKKASHEESKEIEQTARIIPACYPEMQGNSEGLKEYLKAIES